MAQVCKALGVSEQTYYRWRKEYGGLSITVARRLTSREVLDQLAEHFLDRGTPEYIRSDNGSEFTAQAVRDWRAHLGVRTLFIEPGSPWENGYCESFNGKLRDECLNRELFTTLLEAQVVIEQWRRTTRSVRTVRWGIALPRQKQQCR